MGPPIEIFEIEAGSSDSDIIPGLKTAMRGRRPSTYTGRSSGRVGTGILSSILNEEWEHLKAPSVNSRLPDGDRGVVRCIEERSLELD